MLASVRAALLRWARLCPALFRHDPLFRYAVIAAVVALIFLAVGMIQDGGRHDTVSGAGKATGSASTTPDRSGEHNAPPPGGLETAMPPVPGSPGAPSAAENAQPPKIAPGRPLEGVDVTPAPRDDFGTVPNEKEGSR